MVPGPPSRSEQLPAAGERAVASYSQRPHFKFLRANMAEDKDYAAMYQEVKAKLRFPKMFVDHLVDSKYVRHFYGDQERRAMRMHWTA